MFYFHSAALNQFRSGSIWGFWCWPMKPLMDPCKPMVGMGRDMGSGGDMEQGLWLVPLPDEESILDVEMGTEVQEMGMSCICWFLLLSIIPGPIPSEPMLRPITLLLKWWVL
ncbi:hypothetical protein EYF80_040701 [Liparis tanakae]|uniref:Uncharacterized protein n=1 Tax=Liparis tanakae TaxID=230148 RepID=A0A4Z2G6A4_9TELE|nr:hypothetical protein EYF80_040701 [Liparis tanakae]